MVFQEYIMTIMKLNLKDFLKIIKNIKEKNMIYMVIQNLKVNMIIMNIDGMVKQKNTINLVI